MNIKRHINRFRAWQRKPIQFSDQGLEEHCCANCGHTYSGNYCPVCGQKAGDKRITWRLVGQNFLKAWGIDSHSLPSTLMQLMLRPGYLIGDYLDGHRRVSYPPVNMLFVVTVVYLIIAQMFGISRTEHFTYSDVPEKYAIVVDIMNWFIDNPAWGLLTFTLTFCIQTWFFFRFAPRHTRHTLAEGVFIQIYMATISIICTFISNIFTNVIGLFIILVAAYYYVTYRQLFGYRFWGTLWRMLLAIAVAFFLIILIMAIMVTIWRDEKIETLPSLLRPIIIIAVLLAAGYFISRWTAKNRGTAKDNRN
ncbi:MAG: DUF3667 domain-containing protein [Bacteroidales bacterium]|nr:DUF3667 domain-containing protein [Bacteroidales bacterium]